MCCLPAASHACRLAADGCNSFLWSPSCQPLPAPPSLRPRRKSPAAAPGSASSCPRPLARRTACAGSRLTPPGLHSNVRQRAVGRGWPCRCSLKQQRERQQEQPTAGGAAQQRHQRQRARNAAATPVLTSLRRLSATSACSWNCSSALGRYCVAGNGAIA